MMYTVTVCVEATVVLVEKCLSSRKRQRTDENENARRTNNQGPAAARALFAEK